VTLRARIVTDLAPDVSAPDGVGKPLRVPANFRGGVQCIRVLMIPCSVFRMVFIASMQGHVTFLAVESTKLWHAHGVNSTLTSVHGLPYLHSSIHSWEPTVTTLDLVQPDGRWGQPGWLAWGAHSAVAVLTDVLVIACARLSRPQEWRADIASQLSHGTVQS
jgi:hypothetical protein